MPSNTHVTNGISALYIGLLYNKHHHHCTRWVLVACSECSPYIALTIATNRTFFLFFEETLLETEASEVKGKLFPPNPIIVYLMWIYINFSEERFKS